MSFFKRKPKPDVMGFICSETTLNRMNDIAEKIGSQRLNVEVAAFSTAIIQHVLNQQYTTEVIKKTMEYCDKFLFKKHQELKEKQEVIYQQRLDLQKNDLNDEQQIESLVRKTMEDWNVDQEEIQEELISWCHLKLLISSDIKSK